MIRLNKFELKVNSKGYAPLLFFGDLHWGYPTCAEDEAREMLDWALKEKVYVFLLGDLIDAGLRDSIGDSVYRQKLNPQGQMEAVVELLTPLSKKGLIIGMLTGNHEERITQRTSIDISKLMAKELGVPYLGYAGWSLIKVGKQNYKLYTTHGAGGSTLPHTKLNAAVKVAYFTDADIIAYGHLHGLASDIRLIGGIDLRSKQVIMKKQYVVLTGSYLNYHGSYAEMKGFPPAKIGSPKAKFLSETRDVHFSL